MALIKGYSYGELADAVRFERATLVAERTKAVRRLKEIDERLEQLEQADQLLDGFDR